MKKGTPPPPEGSRGGYSSRVPFLIRPVTLRDADETVTAVTTVLVAPTTLRYLSGLP